MTEGGRILVVDDAAGTREVLKRNLTTAGYAVFTAPDVPRALEVLDANPVDLVVTDMKMPQVSGMDLVRHVRENLSETEVVVITGYPTVEGAVEAVKTGAEEYIAKPFTDDELLNAVNKAFEKLRRRRTDAEGGADAVSIMPGDLIGRSPEIARVAKAIEKAAASDATVLITGESGTGKELVARAVHYASKRSSAAFVPINCGAIPENLIESELFGHVKGAFTGAVVSRAGFFQAADGGTVFLDEVSELGANVQVKLLRVLQEREICMLGSDKPRRVDVRIVAATNKDISTLVKKGGFREDLFFRLNVINIGVPRLHDRGDDIVLLTRHFAARFAGDNNRLPQEFTDKALDALTSYHWPGNVRELENVIQRLVVMNEKNVIDVTDLPDFLRFTVAKRPSPNRTLREVEFDYISDVLASVGGNKTRAAEILGIDRKTLREKLKPDDENLPASD